MDVNMNLPYVICTQKQPFSVQGELSKSFLTHLYIAQPCIVAYRALVERTAALSGMERLAVSGLSPCKMTSHQPCSPLDADILNLESHSRSN